MRAQNVDSARAIRRLFGVSRLSRMQKHKAVFGADRAKMSEMRRETFAQNFATRAKILLLRTPDCDFMTWDEPQTIACQVCGSTMFVHRFRGRAPMFYCGNENCLTRSAHPVNKILSDMRERAQLRRERKEQLAAKAAEEAATKPVKKKPARKKST